MSWGKLALRTASHGVVFDGEASPAPGGGSTSFQPSAITGLALWLDAAQLALSDGDPVASWPDLSGNGFNAVQAVAGQRPVFQSRANAGFPSVLFDGVDDLLVAPGPVLAAPPLTLAIACVYASISGTGGNADVIVCNADPLVGSSVGPYIEAIPAPGTWGPSGTLGFPVPFPRQSGNSAFDVLVLAMDAGGVADGSLNRDARGAGSDTAWQLGGVALGRDPATPAVTTSNPANVYIGEVLIYSKALTAAEREQVVSYLAAKFGTL